MSKESPTRFDQLAEAAGRYGQASLDNYALIRSFAEQLADGFCKYLGDNRKCVWLVPPAGPWLPQNYGSGAFSVSGKGFLPLAPISFGLAVRVSQTGDWIRVVVSAAKQGPDLDVTITNGPDFDFRLPLTPGRLAEFFDALYAHLINFFKEAADHFESGSYGGRAIGFDFTHTETEPPAA